MIVYDNQAQFRILFKRIGSVVPSTLPVGLFCLTYGITLAMLRNFGMLDDVLPVSLRHVERPFCLQSTAVVTGYLLVVRTNMALGRWMHGVGEIQTMLSKWGDAFDALNGFFAGRGGTEEERKRIINFRVRVAHWFSLMSCLAFATLRQGRAKLDLDYVPIREIFDQEAAESPARSFSSQKIDWQSEMASGLMQGLDLYVLSAPSGEEVSLLEMSHDKVNTVSTWIIQGVILEIRATTLDTPPPIVSRILQELSNGMLGFNQAHKVAMVPFPFPFAQLVTLLCTVLYLMLPFFIDHFTQNVFFTPILSFVLPMCYCGLNKIAIELEEPFGTDFNDVDIEVRHMEFLHLLMDILKQPQDSPVSKDMATERRILQAIYDRADVFDKDYIAEEISRYMVAPAGDAESRREIRRLNRGSSASSTGLASTTSAASFASGGSCSPYDVAAGASAQLPDIRKRDNSQRKVSWGVEDPPDEDADDGG